MSGAFLAGASAALAGWLMVGSPRAEDRGSAAPSESPDLVDEDRGVDL